MQDVASYLREHEPFTELDGESLRTLARNVEVEYFAAGETILRQDQEPPEHVRMVVSGAVELQDRGRTLDLLGPGEIFGHPAMLSGLPTGFGVKAAEDTLCYRLPSELVLAAFASPTGLRYVARSLLARRGWPGLSERDEVDPARRPVSAFIREPLVMASPFDTVRDVAIRMGDARSSCAVILIDENKFGILTDQDLRLRVVAGDIPLDGQVRCAMTAPAFTVPANWMGTDVTVEMINRGVRHVPVVAQHRVLGVVSDVDLLAADTRAPFAVRRNIERAIDVEDLIKASDELRPTIVALRDAQVTAPQLAGTISAFADAITRRAVALVVADDPAVPPLQWLATGSIGRGEAMPSSDIDSVLSWDGNTDRIEMTRVAQKVLDILARCGFASDDHAASAAHPLFARSASDWHTTIHGWLDRPEDERLLIVIALLADLHLVDETGAVPNGFTELQEGPNHPQFMAQMRRLALAHRPPTGFMRNFVVEASGEHRGRLDIKQGGFLPIVDLARYLALAIGSDSRATPDRLRDAEDAGSLSQSDRATLDQAFRLFLDLRMDHQVEQLRLGETPTDFIEPASLNELVRRYLREAFRAIARCQRDLPESVPR